MPDDPRWIELCIQRLLETIVSIVRAQIDPIIRCQWCRYLSLRSWIAFYVKTVARDGRRIVVNILAVKEWGTLVGTADEGDRHSQHAAS